MEPTAELSNIYLAWWHSYLYNKWLALGIKCRNATPVILSTGVLFSDSSTGNFQKLSETTGLTSSADDSTFFQPASLALFMWDAYKHYKNMDTFQEYSRMSFFPLLQSYCDLIKSLPGKAIIFRNLSFD